MTHKRFGHRIALILAITALGYGNTVPLANADLFGLDDTHSWATGTDTLESTFGFSMNAVTDAVVANGTMISSLASPSGSVDFSPSFEKLTIGGGWATWSHGYTGTVYFRDGEDLLITLPSQIDAFDFYLEPNVFDTFEITATAENGASVTLSQDVSGVAGAKYFGFHTDDGTAITTISISAPATADGFATAEFRISDPIPAPGAALLGMMGLGLVGWVRRRLG